MRMVRKKFLAIEKNRFLYLALMDVSEVTEKLPWLQVTSSSDSESDTGGADDPQGTCKLIFIFKILASCL